MQKESNENDNFIRSILKEEEILIKKQILINQEEEINKTLTDINVSSKF